MAELRVLPLEGDDLAEFLRVHLAGYIQQRVEFGGDDPAEATRIATQQYGEFFPDGAPAPGHHLFVGRDEQDQRVGVLWLHEEHQGSGPVTRRVAFIYDIEINADVRGRGWGRALMGFAETWARDRGATEIGLNVFGGNAIARGLYASLGYQESSVRMTKKLAGE